MRAGPFCMNETKTNVNKLVLTNGVAVARQCDQMARLFFNF